jgi:hypothetical protein
MCLRMVPSLSAAWGACACGSGQYIEAPVLHQPICKSCSFYDGGAVGWQERGDGLAEVVHTTISKLPQPTYVEMTCASRRHAAKLVAGKHSVSGFSGADWAANQSERDACAQSEPRHLMRQVPVLIAALGAVLLAAPVLAQAGDMNGGYHRRSGGITLAQGGAGADSQGAGGLNSATPGSPAAGSLGSTPQELLGRGQQPAQGAATSLLPSQGRGAPDPGADPGSRLTAPGGTGVMPGDQTNQPRR